MGRQKFFNTLWWAAMLPTLRTTALENTFWAYKIQLVPFKSCLQVESKTKLCFRVAMLFLSNVLCCLLTNVHKFSSAIFTRAPYMQSITNKRAPKIEALRQFFYPRLFWSWTFWIFLALFNIPKKWKHNSLLISYGLFILLRYDKLSWNRWIQAVFWKHIKLGGSS